MELTPGRAIYRPEEEYKKLRAPKSYHPEIVVPLSTLSIHAAEFVPASSNVVFEHSENNTQQMEYIKQHQLVPQQLEQQHQHQQQQEFYSNGYGNMQQHDHLQHKQSPQNFNANINTQMSSLNISSVQDRLRTVNNGGSRSCDYVLCYQQPQTQAASNDGQQSEYQQNKHYHRYNKHHHNQSQQHRLHNNQHQQRYNNHQNQQGQTQQQQQQRQQQQQQRQQQQQYHQENQEQSSASAMAESANDMENIALDYLQTVIQCLNQNPGQFDTIATRFNYIFEGMENNHYVLSIAMEEIFNESIRNPNFRYMGAKLYNLLHTLNPSNDSLFHTFLKYKLEFNQEQVREYIQNNQEAIVRECALFLAELYMQLRGEDSRNYLIANNIVFLLKELLSVDDNKDNVRCICLTLKLAGYDLSIDCPADMADIIFKLDTLNCRNPGKYPLANNVIALQRNNWGRKTVGTEQTAVRSGSTKFIEQLRDSDDPVFYGPDGHEITAEECEFLSNDNFVFTANSSENEEDNYDIDLDPEMDEETERDFKLFLQQSNNKL